MKIEFNTKSAAETEHLGKKLGKCINSKTVIAFKGGLGAGKTCFTAGLCRGLGYMGDVTSPTFAIINEYLGGRLPIYHFDVYRIADVEELYEIGFYEYLDLDSILVIEWSENISEALPDNTVFVEISGMGDDHRNISIYGDNNLIGTADLKQQI